MSPNERFYSDDEAQEILRRAAGEDLHGGSLSMDNLLRTGAELGIPREAIEQAAKQVEGERKTKLEREEYRRYVRRGFWGHLTSFVVVNAFLLAINLITSPGHLWFIYPLLGWGMGLAFSASAAFNESSEEWLRGFDRWRRLRERTAAPGGGDSVRLLLEHEMKVAQRLGSAVSKLELVASLHQRAGLDVGTAESEVDKYLAEHPGSPVV